MQVARDPELLVRARQTTRTVARTFSLAVRLLPRDVRDDVHLLYLAFRSLDDLVDDGHPEAADRLAAVEAWCAGAEPPVDGTTLEVSIFTDLATRHPLPREAIADFCTGMRSDLAFVPPRTEAALDEYCYRVAGTVGIVMAAVLGVDGDPDEARRAAAALGMAMQRTNILRDIDEDRTLGRTYLATETVHRFGAPEPGCREALLRDQIARADALYEQGVAGIGLLRSGRPAIRAAAAMYREILRQLEREGYGARAGRAVVPRRRKLAIAARSGLAA